jgi:transcriptional regulator with XRE-family HTH domain
MPSKIELGRAFRAVRRHYNFSQEDFSVASSRTFVSSIERGLKSPTIEKLTQLCDAMGTDAAAVVLLASLYSKGNRAKQSIAKDIRSVVEVVELLSNEDRFMAP